MKKFIQFPAFVALLLIPHAGVFGQGGNAAPNTGKPGASATPVNPEAANVAYCFEIEEISKVPDPNSTLYKDCLSVCRASMIARDGVNRDLLLIVPAFVNRKWTGFRQLKVGQTIQSLQLVPFRDLPVSVRSLQRSDLVEGVGLPQYFSSSWKLLGEPGVQLRFDRNVLAEELPRIQQQSIKRVELKLAREAIAKSMAGRQERIASLLAENGGSWDEWADKARARRRTWIKRLKESGGSERVPGKYYFEPPLDLGYEKAALMEGEAPCVKTLLALHRDLASTGRHLVVVPFPVREEVTWKFSRAADGSPPFSGVAFPSRLRIISTLLQEGVDVVDVVPSLLELDVDELPFYDCADGHPANGTIVATAKLLGDLLGDYGVERNPSAAQRSLQSFVVPHHRELFPKNSSFQGLAIAGGTANFPPERGVVVVGDSFSQVPEPYGLTGANFVDHLSWELGRKVTLIGVRGGAKQVYQGIRRDRPTFDLSTVVIFAFQPGFLTSTNQYRTYMKSPFDYETGKL